MMQSGIGFLPVLYAALLIGGCSAMPNATHSLPGLEGTTWSLSRIGPTSISAGTVQPSPHLVLDAGTKRASGSSGCNRFTGTYEIDGDRIAFGRMAGTRMACSRGMDIEQAFLAALEQAKAWNIAMGKLVLFDGNGVPLAELTAGSRR